MDGVSWKCVIFLIGNTSLSYFGDAQRRGHACMTPRASEFLNDFYRAYFQYEGPPLQGLPEARRGRLPGCSKRNIFDPPRGRPVGGGGTIPMGFGAKPHKLITIFKFFLIVNPDETIQNNQVKNISISVLLPLRLSSQPVPALQSRPGIPEKPGIPVLP